MHWFFLFVASALPACKALKVGFVGDTKDGEEAERSFSTFREHNVELVVHNGDFDYASDPARWDEFLESNWYAKGKSDVIVTSGNHEESSLSTVLSGGTQWEGENGYKNHMYSRLMTNSALNLKEHCYGRRGKTLHEDYGEFMTCEVDGVLVVNLGWNIMTRLDSGSTKEKQEIYDFIRDSLSQSNATWRVCNWHRPEGKVNPAKHHTRNYNSQYAYEICRQFGAFIVSGHAHVYGRTKLLENFSSMSLSQESDNNIVKLDCGKSFAIVSGLGGKSVEDVGRFGKKEWFASRYTTDIGEYTNGVLICDFRDTTAECTFTLGDNALVHDQFTVTPPPASSFCESFPIPPPLPEAKSVAWFIAPAGALIGGLMVYVRRQHHKRRQQQEPLLPEPAAEMGRLERESTTTNVAQA